MLIFHWWSRLKAKWASRRWGRGSSREAYLASSSWAPCGYPIRIIPLRLPFKLYNYHHCTRISIFTFPNSSRKTSLHSLTLRINIIAHSFIVAWETLSWVSDRIMWRYFGLDSNGSCDLWFICTRLVRRRRIPTICPSARIFCSSKEFI